MGNHLPRSQIENQNDWLHVWYLFYTQMQSIWCSHRPRAAWAGKSRPDGKTIPISGGTPTYLYCTELISQLKQINEPGNVFWQTPLWPFYILLLPLDGKSSDQQVEKKETPEG